MIVRNSIQETTGTENNVAQSFYQNIFYNVSIGITSPFVFEVPKYTTNGGTTDYYGQNPLAIFTNLVKPFIRFDFSANTTSFGPDVYIKHDFYRVDWDLYNNVSKEIEGVFDINGQVDEQSVETISELDGDTGEIKSKTITRSKVNSILQRNESKPQDRVANQNNTNTFKKPTILDIAKQLSEPIFSISASTSGITTNIYDLEIDQFIKNLGQFKTDLFQDRAQYIIDTNFVFNRSVTSGLYDLKILTPLTNQLTGELNSGFSISNEVYSSTITSETKTEKQVITNGYYSGVEFVGGEYFCYFEVPDKSVFEYPTAEGLITTFTPEIFWSNGEKADEYLIQASYNTGDTGFTGSVFTYIVPKLDEFKEESDSKIKDSTSEFSSKKTIRKYEISLKSNSSVIYRVGNVKFIKNIFGVKQSVVTFSDNKIIITQTEPIRTFVYTESDSPYTPTISGLVTPPSIEDESPLSEYTLSGTVSGSTVTGATMQLIYPNSSFITTITDDVGGFSFNSLEAGTYTLNTTYRGYAMDSRQVVINSDTDLNFDIQVNWDNTYDIWAIKENDIIKY